MLVYHPAYDAYHCIFRALLITDFLQSIEVQRLRILDFYLSFPAEIRGIRLPREHGEARKLAQGLANEYHGPVSTSQAFRDMEHIQEAAFRTLAASEIFSPTHFEDGIIFRSEMAIPDEFRAKLSAAKERDKGTLDYIVKGLGSLPLRGDGGLKHRTGLMEHRYDVA